MKSLRNNTPSENSHKSEALILRLEIQAAKATICYTAPEIEAVMVVAQASMGNADSRRAAFSCLPIAQAQKPDRGYKSIGCAMTLGRGLIWGAGAETARGTGQLSTQSSIRPRKHGFNVPSARGGT